MTSRAREKGENDKTKKHALTFVALLTRFECLFWANSSLM